MFCFEPLPGMLLELPVPVLDQMIHDEELLSAGLEKALSTLQNSTEKWQDFTHTSLGCCLLWKMN